MKQLKTQRLEKKNEQKNSKHKKTILKKSQNTTIRRKIELKKNKRRNAIENSINQCDFQKL